MKKKIIIIAVIVVLIIVSLLIIELNKNKKEEIQSEEVEKLGYSVNIEESKKELEEELNEIEKQFQEEKGSYTRNDLYNTLLSMNNNNTNNYIEIVDLGDINFNAEKYNPQLEKIEELPEVNVKLSNRYNLEEGNYYLIRYQSIENGNYMIYYIGQLKKDGFKNLKFYCITTGEYITYGM